METPSYIEEGFPFTGRKLEKLKAFLHNRDLNYDSQITYSVLVCDPDGRILGTASRDRNVLKCIAIADKMEGEGLLGTLMTYVLTNAHKAGQTHLFLFTKPVYAPLFNGLGFTPIIETEHILLMENTAHGIWDYLEHEQHLTPCLSPETRIGAIVMNANPFTNGHLYLIEEARKDCDFLHVFVLSSEDTFFPPDTRLNLVRQGCSGFSDVAVHGGSDYLISHATFPDYFLKDSQVAEQAKGELDLQIFCKYFRDTFHIAVRYVGNEPFCATTKAYNTLMQQILPANGIEVKIIPRLCQNNLPVSATKVREYLKNHDLDAVRPLVPVTTYDYLLKEKIYE